jgi:pimeloyl-ACP methyl ester carboxylesterase
VVVGTVARDGVRLAWHDLGGTDHAALLLHGLAGHAGEWAATAHWLRPRYRVIALDQRGHGASERHPADVSRAAYVADVVAVIEELRLAPVVLFGQSLGGHTALLAAAARPDLVRALVLLDAGPGGPDPEAPARIGTWLDSWPVPFATRQAAIEFLGGGPVGAAWAAGLEHRDTHLAHRDTLLEHHDTRPEQRDTTLEHRDTRLEQRSTRLEQRSTRLEQRDTRLEQRPAGLEQRESGPERHERRPDWRRSGLEPPEPGVGWWPRFDRDVMVASLAETARRAYWDEWSAIRCPTLVVLAGRGIISAADERRMRAGGPSRRIVTRIPDVGHDLHLADPEATRSAMAPFLHAFG